MGFKIELQSRNAEISIVKNWTQMTGVVQKYKSAHGDVAKVRVARLLLCGLCELQPASPADAKR